MDQVKGFAVAAGKVVLDGGVGEILEIARANLRNMPRPAITYEGGRYIARRDAMGAQPAGQW